MTKRKAVAKAMKADPETGRLFCVERGLSEQAKIVN
jgi:hypothetical protein